MDCTLFRNRVGHLKTLIWLALSWSNVLLMKINSRTRWYCLVRSQSWRERTHAHKYAQPKRLWTNQNCSSARWCASMHQCQGHEIAPDAAWLWVRVQELIISINNKFWHNSICYHSPLSSVPTRCWINYTIAVSVLLTSTWTCVLRFKRNKYATMWQLLCQA